MRPVWSSAHCGEGCRAWGPTTTSRTNCQSSRRSVPVLLASVGAGGDPDEFPATAGAVVVVPAGAKAALAKIKAAGM